MITKTMSAVVAVAALGFASTAFAQGVTVNADRTVSSYEQAAPAAYARAQANDLRAAGPRYEYSPSGAQGHYPTSDQTHWYERAPIDFNS
jgi:hypothetical protein